MTANLERVRELLEMLAHEGCLRGSDPCWNVKCRYAREALALLSPAQPPPEPAPNALDRAELAGVTGTPPTRKLTPEERKAYAERIAARVQPLPSAEQLRVAVEALETIWRDPCDAHHHAANALAKLRPAKGGG